MGGRLRLFCESLFFFFGGGFWWRCICRMIENVYVYVDRLVDDIYIRISHY